MRRWSRCFLPDVMSGNGPNAARSAAEIRSGAAGSFDRDNKISLSPGSRIVSSADSDDGTTGFCLPI
jgi:hypothetical protein